MCGTSTVGQTFQTPITSTATNTTQVAGESGKGVAQGGGGTDIASALADITKQIEALKQALAGNSSVAAATGGGAPTKVAGESGGGDAKAGAGGCGGMGGAEGGGGCGGGGDAATKAGGDVDAAGGGGDKSTTQTGTQTTTQTDKDSDVEADKGPGGKKDSDVDGTGGTGDPTQKDQQSEVDAAKSALDTAKKTATDKADAVKAADAKVVEAKDAVTKAEKDVKAADEAKTAAHDKVAEAQKALDEARKSGGTYHTADGDTWDSIASKYSTTVDKLKAANPNAQPGSGDKFAAGTELKLPAGVGNEHAVAEATLALNAAKKAEKAAAKALVDAIAALEAAKAAQAAAEAAAEAAKTAAEEAQKAADAAQKAYDDAVKAAEEAAKKAAEDANKTEQTDGIGSTTDGGGETAKTYTVESGDTLSKIAAKFGISDWHTLYDLNKETIGTNPDLIQPGTVLKLPDGTQSAEQSGEQSGTQSGEQSGSQASTGVTELRKATLYGHNRDLNGDGINDKYKFVRHYMSDGTHHDDDRVLVEAGVASNPNPAAGTVLESHNVQRTRTEVVEAGRVGQDMSYRTKKIVEEIKIDVVADGKGGTSTKETVVRVISSTFLPGRML